MPVLTVGKTEIAYEIRWSEKARRRRIVVVPEGVEVVAPVGESEESLHAFMHDRRRWIYDRRQEMREIVCGSTSLGPRRIVTGAKVPFRGRQMPVRITPSSNGSVMVRYRSGFQIERPADATDRDVASALEQWLKSRARGDVEAFSRNHGRLLGLFPSAVRVKELKHHWGSCGAGGIIHLNWRLIFAPKPVLEYAVVHELLHLRHRNHSPEFWSALRRALPDYERRKEWLERNERALGRMEIHGESVEDGSAGV